MNRKKGDRNRHTRQCHTTSAPDRNSKLRVPTALVSSPSSIRFSHPRPSMSLPVYSFIHSSMPPVQQSCLHSLLRTSLSTNIPSCLSCCIRRRHTCSGYVCCTRLVVHALVVVVVVVVVVRRFGQAQMPKKFTASLCVRAERAE